jgi:cob(I)alamin adenosyltransferase
VDEGVDASEGCHGGVHRGSAVIGARDVGLERDRAAQRIDGVLAFVQQELFDVGSQLATPPESEYEGMIRIDDAAIARLEGWMDELSPDLPELKSFVLPGGGAAAALP